jgi:hypothetical protein
VFFVDGARPTNRSLTPAAFYIGAALMITGWSHRRIIALKCGNMPFTILLPAVALSVFLWGASRRRTTDCVDDQLGRYLEDNPTSILQGSPMIRSAEPGFAERVMAPALRHFLNRLGSLTPNRNVETLGRRLETAGRPFDLTVLNFLGVKFIAALLFAVAGFALFVFLHRPERA